MDQRRWYYLIHPNIDHSTSALFWETGFITTQGIYWNRKNDSFFCVISERLSDRPLRLCPVFQFLLHFASSIDFLWLYLSKYFLCIYNPSRRLNVYCMKSKNIWLRFIASSFKTSMSPLSRLRAIPYCSNNSSLPAILFHGLPISNEFIFLRSRL